MCKGVSAVYDISGKYVPAYVIIRICEVYFYFFYRDLMVVSCLHAEKAATVIKSGMVVCCSKLIICGS